ncbi:hypothetical protein NTHI1209_00796 [Haemophilus influenzae]|uniref:Uncharacterized protein n=1 Tax=Haemophilus influenzae TaxID=727 RepID=A0A158SWE9_HAEIF|nr:hypothetical protein NTHI1209_00796 [Haemophilus influenzae]
MLKNKNRNHRTLRNKKFLKFSLEMRKNIHILQFVINRSKSPTPNFKIFTRSTKWEKLLVLT